MMKVKECLSIKMKFEGSSLKWLVVEKISVYFHLEKKKIMMKVKLTPLQSGDALRHTSHRLWNYSLPFDQPFFLQEFL